MATARSKSKSRTRLVESETELALRRRGTELVGLALIVIAALVMTLIWTYSPDDPSLFSATDAPPRNALGLLGASMADPLRRALGWASYGVAVVFGVWGLRLVLHSGENRVVSRVILAPLALLAAAAFASTHVPLESWTSDYGLGGLLGDASLSGILGLIPVRPTLSLPFVSLALGLTLAVTGGFALGVTWSEFTSFLRFLRTGSVLIYASLLGLVGRAASTAAGGAIAARDLAAEARARRATAPAAAAAPRPSRAEPSTSGIPRFDPKAFEEPQDEGVMARVTAAVRARSEPKPARPNPLTREAPPLTAEEAEVDLLDREDPALVPPPPEARVRPVPQKPRPRTIKARSEEPSRLEIPAGDGTEAYQTPPLSLLQSPDTIIRHHLSTEGLENNARLLEGVLDDYGVRGEITSIRPGPVITMYELEPAAGLKASRVIGLSDDIARSMSALACRVSTIPGRSVIGIELPNELREKVLLREILSAKGFGDTAHALPLALGKDIGGEPVVANLARMPHLLIAGTTGSGKSVAINTMILSLLYKLSPEECRLIMIDPKMLELSVYDGIPHLLSPVVTDPKKAVVALKWVVAEMEERYRKMSKMGVRNIDGYNMRVKDALERGEGFTRTVQTGFDEDTGEPMFETEEFQPKSMPYIVVIVDEMADLMMVAGKEIEACIQRLAQMARASGIHLIMATQRPSVDVITGTIKANFPTRISFQVTSKIDSRTILGEMGAEQLLGQGDMLYMAGGGRVTRVHGPFVSDEEVEEVVTHLKSYGAPDYDEAVLDGPDADEQSDIDAMLGLGGNTTGDDQLYDQAVAIVAKDRKCSTSYIQRKLSVGYNKAAKLVELMEEAGVVSQANHVGKREVLVPER